MLHDAFSDDDLLDRLGHALAPEPVEPTMAELSSLQRAVARPRRPRRLSPRIMVALIGLGTVATSGTAFAVPHPQAAVVGVQAADCVSGTYLTAEVPPEIVGHTRTLRQTAAWHAIT